MNDPFPAAPPSVLPSEQIVAGACLLGAMYVDEAAMILSEDDFQSNATRLIFSTARGLAEANQPVSAAAVAVAMRRIDERQTEEGGKLRGMLTGFDGLDDGG